MAESNVEEFGAADAGAEELEAYLARNAPEIANASSEEIRAALGDLLSEIDHGVLTGEFADYLAASTRTGLERGFWGWFDDDIAFVRDWGFDVRAISVPVAIWQGGEDRFVPFAHGEWLAQQIPTARPHLHREQGHLSLTIGAYGDVLDDLLAADRD